MLYAHTPNQQGKWHTLEEHLARVAELAAEYAAAFGGAELAYWAGAWHDVGKASEAFQRYLHLCAREPSRRFATVDHKGAGTLRALDYADVLAFLIHGHHGGLPDQDALRTRIKELRDVESTRGSLAREALQRAIDAGVVPPRARAGEAAFPDFITDEVTLESFLRFLFSALVDADCLDTEAHGDPDLAGRRGSFADLGALLDRVTAAQQRLMEGATGAVNAVRREVYEACLAAAAQPPGFFRLTVPTGGGKTRSALAFALQHAVSRNLRRVITVCPYLTITDQTADVYRSILGGEGVVLEHHSDATRNDDPEGEPTPEAIWRRLAAENWDAPVIVTTAVQFFESLFANRTTACRKLHRIARSVVILDEVQTLPPKLLAPILDMLRQLVQHFGVSVLLCTATQPALADAPGFRGLPNVREIMPDPPRLFRVLRRVRYTWPAEPWPWERVAGEMREASHVLAVVNTKTDALRLLDALNDPEALHLSTLLCGAHRRDVLALIRARLRSGEPCRVVSTQVVEAGVDLDFPMVLRALGPLDRIVQAAGRCNREGLLAEGRVVVFEPAEGGMPAGAYRTASDVTKQQVRAGAVDPDDPETFQRYFAELFRSIDLDARQIQDLRKRLAFEQVASTFRLIDDDTVSVFVRYRGIEGMRGAAPGSPIDHAAITDRLVNAARRMEAGPGVRAWVARAQPYLVALRRRAVERLAAEGLISVLFGDVWLWHGAYDLVRGLGRLDTALLDAAEMVV
jgi:CRISPR-associated endonuclease/helicase Cas3